LTWNGVNANAYSNLQSSHAVSYANGNAQPTTYRYEFDISNAVISWMEGVDSSKGLVFKASDTAEAGTAHVYKTFGSYNRASYKPVLTFVVRDIDETIVTFSPNNDAEKTTTYESPVTTLTNGKVKVYSFTPDVSAEYSVWTTGAADEDIYIDVHTSSDISSASIIYTSRPTGEHEGDYCDPNEGDYSLTKYLYTSEITPMTYYFAVYSIDPTETVTYTFHCVRGLPLSGSERKYQPELWNIVSVQPYANCYAYALNTQEPPIGEYDAYLQLGQSELGIFGIGDQYYTQECKADILYYISCDAEAWGFTFEEVGQTQICDAGTYKVALVIDPKTSELDNNNDFHWYRQNDDGTWSHKPGGCMVTNEDGDSGLPPDDRDDEEDFVIFDPDTANRNNGSSNYSWFVGYFQVSPLSTFDEIVAD